MTVAAVQPFCNLERKPIEQMCDPNIKIRRDARELQMLFVK